MIRFYEAFIDGDQLHIVTDYAAYGDLFRQMKKHAQRNTTFSERAVWSFFLQLVIGIKYMHEHGILHRDIKAANIFVDGEGCLKIGDFGIAKILRPGSMHATDQIGSPYYVSPEIWKKRPYDTKSDMWAIGCFLYELIALHPPFRAANMEDLSKKIITGKYEPLPTSTSPELQRLVRNLLALEPKARPDIQELLDMQVVQEHMHLLPSVPKSSRGKTAPPPQQEFMDLRNTIHTPRRMNDMKHLLPVETRYEDDKRSDRRGEKGRRRVHSQPVERGEEPTQRTRSHRDQGERSHRRHEGHSHRRQEDSHRRQEDSHRDRDKRHRDKRGDSGRDQSGWLPPLQPISNCGSDRGHDSGRREHRDRGSERRRHQNSHRV